MCGICGIAQRDSRETASEASLHRMAAAIAHRGPDGQQAVVLGPVGLGHRRLAIVDRTPAGRQPMSNAAGTLWVVYNGEIYNYLEERQHLESRGYRFRSRSDTEVLLYLYEEYGEGCLDRLQGMFAFGVWDSRADTLFLARDRFGKKPLYYQLTPRQFLFASEIKALLAAGHVRPPVDTEALHHFLSFDYVPAPRTAFEGICRLPAGHRLVYRNGDIHVRQYFKPSHAVRLPVPAPDEAAVELRRSLSRAIRRRLIGEVPIGVFLSGGIDSSSIVALMSETGGAPIQTFSIGFREASHDESRYARLVSDRYGTHHHEFVASPDVVSELPHIIRQYDGPFGDPSALPTYMLAREARRDITVALTGDGGDEAFAGYERYVKNAAAERYLRFPRSLRRAAAAAFRGAVRRSLPFEHPLRRLARFTALDDPSLERLYCRWLLHFDTGEKEALYTREFGASDRQDSCALVQDLFDRSDGADLTARELSVDVASYLPDDLLVKTDIATMAHGMEARCPFLDQEVAAFSAALPSSYKLRGLRTKWILSRAMRDVLPPEILNRPKQGFGVPIDQWLKSELRPLVHESLLGKRAIERGYFREPAVRRLVEEHERGERQWQYHIWNLLVLELWHREVVD